MSTAASRALAAVVDAEHAGASEKGVGEGRRWTVEGARVTRAHE